MWRYHLVTSAHTFLGLGKKTETHTDFEFKVASGYAGTKLQVRIYCDNSKCKKDVEKFVFKWF